MTFIFLPLATVRNDNVSGLSLSIVISFIQDYFTNSCVLAHIHSEGAVEMAEEKEGQDDNIHMI